jgi:hypothetical protein
MLYALYSDYNNCTVTYVCGKVGDDKVKGAAIMSRNLNMRSDCLTKAKEVLTAQKLPVEAFSAVEQKKC